MQERLRAILRIKNHKQRKAALVVLLTEARAAGLYGIIAKINALLNI